MLHLVIPNKYIFAAHSSIKTFFNNLFIIFVQLISIFGSDPLAAERFPFDLKHENF